jgi:hypothetical protein
LAQAIEKNVSALRAGRAVEQAATEWHDKGRPPDRLWERGQLAAALADTGAHPHAHDLVTDRVTLSPTARAFLRASIRRDRLRRRRAVTVLSVLLVLALAVAGFVVSQRHTMEQQRKVALAQQVAGRALELRVTNPALAAQLSLAAYRLDATTKTRSSLLSTVANPYAPESTSDVNVKAVAVSHDGHTLATGSQDGTVPLWDVRDPRRPSPLGKLEGHEESVRSVAFSPDGHTLATDSEDTTARLWQVSDPRQPHLLSILLGHGNGVRSVAFSPNGRTVVTASADNSVRLWDISDLRNPRHLGTLTGHDHFVNSVVFSPDGHTVATGSNDGRAKLWETDVISVAAQICSSTPLSPPASGSSTSPACRTDPHAHEHLADLACAMQAIYCSASPQIIGVLTENQAGDGRTGTNGRGRHAVRLTGTVTACSTQAVGCRGHR